MIHRHCSTSVFDISPNSRLSSSIRRLYPTFTVLLTVYLVPLMLPLYVPNLGFSQSLKVVVTLYTLLLLPICMTLLIFSVISKVCQMLKSRSWDIREGSRKMLCRMAGSLGSRYAAFIIREMKAILRRGYQLHVLTHTVHILLTHLSETLTPGDLEPCLNDVLMVVFFNFPSILFYFAFSR